jgi:type III pantothenate kinase
MILLIDVGNTRVKWAQLLDDNLTPQQALTHKGLEPKQWVEKLFRERFRPARVLVGNVAGADMAALIRAEAEKKWQVTPEFAASMPFAAGVTNAYADASALGVDRWLAVIAAHDIGGAACVIDAGTAVTVDVINAQGLHLGGLIVPGIDMMMSSLLDRTSDIAHKAARTRAGSAKTDATAAVQMFAGSTPGAVANGALVALAATADRAAAEAAQQCGGAAKLRLTGGDAERLARAMQTPCEIIPELVLRGLAVLARNPPPTRARSPSYNRRP